MKSIREIYKIGKGPSSSHTMGPERAARLFKKDHPEADGFKVILYGSLSKTGVGHGTDRVLREVLSPLPTEIVFSKENLKDAHPNTMDFFAYKDGKELANLRVASIGGGDIRIPGREDVEGPDIYLENTFAEIADLCKWRYMTRLSDYVELYEGPEIWDFLQTVWDTMKASIDAGLSTTGILPGGLGVQRKARFLLDQQRSGEAAPLRECRIISAYAYAVAEQNADNGTIVTAPTCGACGVLPAVLQYFQETQHADDSVILKGLATAGIIGSVTKRNASISGAECGCQAEIGTACAMAAAALAELYGLTLDQVEYAAEIAMEHSLGLTCDPICGLVQIPCIERNAVGAIKAYNACLLATCEKSSQHMVSLDAVIMAMNETGREMNAKFKETSEGGLAVSLVEC